MLYPPSERSELARYHVMLFPSICEHSVFRCKLSRKQFELETWYQLPTNRKWPMADRMMTSSMMSRDRERSRSYTAWLKSQFRGWCSTETVVRRGGITNHRSIAYTLSNISTKNYQNQLMCIEAIMCNISVIFNSVLLTSWQLSATYLLLLNYCNVILYGAIYILLLNIKTFGTFLANFS